MVLVQKTCDYALEPTWHTEPVSETHLGEWGTYRKVTPRRFVQSRQQDKGWLCKLQHATTLVEEVAHAFRNLLALVLNLSYKEEGLQYYRICSKILTILLSFLKTSQQPVLQIANTSTWRCTKVRIKTVTVFLNWKYQYHPKLPWDSKLGHNHQQPWDTCRTSEIQSALETE